MSTLTYNTRKSNWFDHNESSNELQTDGLGTAFIPTKEMIRDMMVVKNREIMRERKGLPPKYEPSFFCPACHEHFVVEYGVFGKIPLDRYYGERQFWCIDCASLNNITVIRR